MQHRRHDPVQRLNDKHPDELLAIARSLGGHPDALSARAEAVDRLGIAIVVTTRHGPVDTRVAFSEPVADPKWLRASFKELTRRAEAARAAEGSPPNAS